MEESPHRPVVGRGPKVRAAVLAATIAELAEKGYAELAVEGVARRAGVHKTTVYRRWKDRQGLVVDALSERVADEVPIPDTGSVQGDVEVLARSLADTLGGPTGRVIAAVLGTDAARLPEVAGIRRRVLGDRLRRAEPVVLRAVARGELPEGTGPHEVVKAFAAPLYFRLLVSGEPVDRAAADRAARIALAAARAGELRTG
ncbi:TetR/AcrR family transcriptional regulator [Nocardiopsis sp. CNT-189]|uniref:TetR/AcrR family transcriptional regulator n=1 Tax=Nocardiopsis oceanisediminis TaxID=2816862 RepID=UPI003B3A9EF9